jgi:hypothetical protein
MSVPVVFAVAGIVALFLSVWGGGIKAKEVEIPQSSSMARLIVGVVGLILIGISIWLILPTPLNNVSQPLPTVPILDTPTAPLRTPNPTTIIFTETLPPSPTLTSVPDPNLVFNEPFDDNKLGWYVGDDSADVNFTLHREIKDGKYYRYMEMKSIPPDGTYWGSVAIPSVIKSNFCLIFDAQKVGGTAKDAGIVIKARLINDYDSNEPVYYYILLYEDGKGVIKLVPNIGNVRQLGTFNNSFAWNDKLTHTIAISLQDNIFEIIDWQTKTPLYKLTIASDDLLSDQGNIYIGTQLSHPGDNITLELDNIFVYDRCPQ